MIWTVRGVSTQPPGGSNTGAETTLANRIAEFGWPGVGRSLNPAGSPAGSAATRLDPGGTVTGATVSRARPSGSVNVIHSAIRN